MNMAVNFSSCLPKESPHGISNMKKPLILLTLREMKNLCLRGEPTDIDYQLLWVGAAVQALDKHKHCYSTHL